MKATMMTLAFAALAMTANANPHGNNWRNGHTAPAPRMEARHHNHADWRHCRHNHIDRHGNRTFCLACGAEIIWRGNARTGYYEVIPPRTAAHYHGNAPVPPPPGRGHRR